MSNILFFLVFYRLIYLYGKGFTNLFRFKINNIFKHNISLFYPIIGLFFIGNISVILNFFTKLNSSIVILFLLSLFLLNLLPSKTEIPKDGWIYLHIVIPSILAVSSSGVGLSGDAGLYHLNHQEWLRTNKIVFGLVNSHFRFGFSSISEWISANFWINNNLIFLHYLNLVFIVFFFQLIFSNIFIQKDSIHKKTFTGILIVGILDNFGLNGGKNGFIEIEAIGKFDTVFAILFFISTLLIIDLHKNSYSSKEEVFTIALMTLFTFQYRIFGIMIIILFLFILFKKGLLLETLKHSYILITFFIAWIIKNLINTSCLIYPIELTCLEFSFSPTQNASTNIALSDIRNVHKPLLDNDIQTWFMTWVERDINETVLKNFIFTLTILLIFSFFFLKRNFEVKNNFSILNLFTLFSLLVWIISAPGIRLGIGVILLLYVAIPDLINRNKSKYKFIDSKKFLVTLFFTTIFLVPQIDNYKVLIENISNITLRELPPSTTNYEKNLNGFGVIPVNNSDKCWVNLDCIRNSDEITKTTYRSYIFIKGKK